VNKEQLTDYAATFGCTFQQGQKKGAGYNLVTEDGEMPLGHDYSASLADIKRHIEGLDKDPDDEVEEEINEDGGISNPKPVKAAKERGPSPQAIAASVRGHDNAARIKDVLKPTADYTKEDDHLIKALDNLLHVVNNSTAATAFYRQPKEVQAKH
jgi:hypothetical protein